MLAYSGKGQFEIHALNLNALIEENLHLFEVAVPKQVQLQMQLAPDLPYIEADAGQIQQVIMNLIMNGVEAMENQPGRLLLHTSTDYLGRRERPYLVSLQQPFTSGQLCTARSTG